MKFTTIKMSFAADVSPEDMLKILAKDNKSLRSRGKGLLETLKDIDGVCYVSYDGNLGPNFFIEIDKPNKAQDILKIVKLNIEGYIS